MIPRTAKAAVGRRILDAFVAAGMDDFFTDNPDIGSGVRTAALGG